MDPTLRVIEGQVKDVCCFSIHNKIVRKNVRWKFHFNQSAHSSVIGTIHGLTVVQRCNRKKADVLFSNKNKQT